MSQDFLDPEIINDFILEAKEHLETIEPNLLELEKAPENLALLNEIFRPMHSLKGASGFLGFNTMNRLAHRAENILDELRKGEMSVTSEIMDVILSATDALRQMIDNLEAEGVEGDVEVDELVATIDRIMAGGGEPAAPAAPPAAPEPEPDFEHGNPPEPDNAVNVEPPAAEEAEPDFEHGVPPAPEPTAAAQPEGEGEIHPEFADETLEPYALTAFGESHLNDFLEEAQEIVENLNAGLVSLEKEPEAWADTTNDLFRYFHNLKGNSGIIGFKELNGLTHEAETLLNRVRKGEMDASAQGLVDLLLLVVDTIESLVSGVDTQSGTVNPVTTTAVKSRLRRAVESGVIEAPVVEAVQEEAAQEMPAPAEEATAPAGEPAPAAEAPASGGYDSEDVAIYETTVKQQLGAVRLALEKLTEDADNTEYVDALYRALVTIQNSSGYMGLEEVQTYAQRTAALVDQARSAGIGFEPLLDIMKQETSILADMVEKELLNITSGAAEQTGPTAEPPAPEPNTEKSAPVKSAAAPEPEKKAEPAPQPEKKTEPAPKQEHKAAPAPKAEPKPALKDTQPAPAAKKAPEPEAAADKKTPPPPSGQAQAQAQKPKVSSTIRVDHEKLDHLMNLIGELIINRNRFTMIARNLEEHGDELDIADTAQNLTETTFAMARISDDLQDTIMKVRMVPVQTVFSRFPRLVRDLSRKSGKQVELITEGEETELDKSVVEVIGDPLVHLIRNSVDHGIESEEQRVKAGKPAKGTVWLRAYYRGNSVAIEIEDNGKGIDPEKMREVAVRKGVISPEEAKNLDDREARELIFAPGFSSADTITDISGRGGGMDVVRTNIKNLKGSVSITSETGKFTRFTLILPLTLAIIDALMVKVGGDTYAIPLDAVSETTKIETRRLTEVNGRKAVTLRGQVLGIISLCEMLELPPPEKDPEILSVVVIQDGDRRLGLVVDRLLERQEIVIKPLGAYLGDQKGISGATIMGDGSVVLILDPHEIYLMATSKAI
ncbi:chemotaxis protein CheA [Oceanidesulfovibrio indonesiensis]|uniref:Chemotaxis protein CheA n=1 Tax=Oceanidesulfovibrio indonesiensis TaxID=54767 RepID=A0A7M3MJP5_9BACT|nr:chemotaxis protein CheA [Oceanidesulfovibrio indonesiensis]TVM19900.1 chemotaxis protein CheA [Oceanidesulfovibrio indonesiensis]